MISLPSSNVLAGYNASLLVVTAVYSLASQSFDAPPPMTVFRALANGAAAVSLLILATGTTCSPSAEHRYPMKLAGCGAAGAAAIIGMCVDAILPSQSPQSTSISLILDALVIITGVIPLTVTTIAERVQSPSFNHPYQHFRNVDSEARGLLSTDEVDREDDPPSGGYFGHVPLGRTRAPEPGAHYVSSSDDDARARLSGMTQRSPGPLIIHVSVEVYRDS